MNVTTIWRNLPVDLVFTNYVNNKSTVKFLQIFLAFLENLNFKGFFINKLFISSSLIICNGKSNGSIKANHCWFWSQTGWLMVQHKTNQVSGSLNFGIFIFLFDYLISTLGHCIGTRIGHLPLHMFHHAENHDIFCSSET